MERESTSRHYLAVGRGTPQMLLKTELKIQCFLRSYSFRLSFAVLQAGAMNGKQSHSAHSWILPLLWAIYCET